MSAQLSGWHEHAVQSVVSLLGAKVGGTGALQDAHVDQQPGTKLLCRVGGCVGYAWCIGLCW